MKKISIIFLLSRSRLNRAGKCTIRCRITYLKERHEFAIGQFVNPANWYSKEQLAKPPNEENTFVNTQVSLIKNKINQAFLLLQLKGQAFGVEDIYSVYIRRIFKKG
ncbi:MAG: recombinase [Flavobacterium sp.]|nr:recombinase [Flavobacterium sp.]